MCESLPGLRVNLLCFIYWIYQKCTAKSLRTKLSLEPQFKKSDSGFVVRIKSFWLTALKKKFSNKFLQDRESPDSFKASIIILCYEVNTVFKWMETKNIFHLNKIFKNRNFRSEKYNNINLKSPKELSRGEMT